MNEAVKAIGMYALTGIVSAIAARYHLNGEQTAAVMADIMALVVGGSGVAMHWAAYKTIPPK